MIDRTQLQRLITQATGKKGAQSFMLDLANVIYKAGMEDMRERAAKLVDERHDELEPWMCGDDVRALEIES